MEPLIQPESLFLVSKIDFKHRAFFKAHILLRKELKKIPGQMTTTAIDRISEIINRLTFLIFIGLVLIYDPFGSRTFYSEVAKK